MVYNLFDKSEGSDVNNEIKQNQQQLAEELHKPIMKNFKKEEFILHFRQYLGC